MKLPKLTPKQHTILLLLYKFRFLNRVQIQTLMKHKDYRRINAWLANLRANHFVEWIYSTNFIEKSKPGIYYLGINGIRQLKESQCYPIEAFRKRYRESARSRGFIDRCVLLADCCIALDKLTVANPVICHTSYSYATEADYLDTEGDYHFIGESDLIRPHLIFKETVNVVNEEEVAATRFIEIIEATMPRYRVRNRLKKYIEYLEDGYWQNDTNADEPNPIVMIVCPTLTDMIYCKRATKRLLAEKWDEDIVMWFTTADKLKTQGLTGKIWEEVKPPHDDDE